MAIDLLEDKQSPLLPPYEVLVDAEYAGYFLQPDRIRPGSFVTRYRHPSWGLGWILAEDPSEIRTAETLDEVEGVLNSALNWDGFSAIVLPYGSAGAFHPHIQVRPDAAKFAWVALYRPAVQFFKELGPVLSEPTLIPIGQDYAYEGYEEAFAAVKSSLQEGECYQVNLTQRLSFELAGTAWDLFATRTGVTPPPYATFVHQGESQVSSWSPELFVEKRGQTVRMKPMKGTAPREDSPDSLKTSKTFAENLMILDMVRNDLGKVAKIASVTVPQAFSIEPHRSVWQMTSTVEACFEGEPLDLLRAVFPPASVTGAPKRAACSVIHRLEHSPRGLYCGALGYAFQGDLRLSVAIRTAEITSGRVTYGVGSGIVWDSDGAEEYKEWQLKAEMLLSPAEPWALLETMANDILERPSILELHLGRLRKSCLHFGISFDRERILRALHGRRTSHVSSSRIRLRLLPDGAPLVEAATARPGGVILQFAVASWPVSSEDPSLRLKTTARQAYQEHLDAASALDEVLLLNEDGALTEFTTGALLLRSRMHWFSPPVECGCLPSVGLMEMEGVIRQSLTVEDLEGADEIWMVNARGRWQMNWVRSLTPPKGSCDQHIEPD